MARLSIFSLKSTSSKSMQRSPSSQYRQAALVQEQVKSILWTRGQSKPMLRRLGLTGAAVVFLAFQSCSETSVEQEDVTKISIGIEALDRESDTRASIDMSGTPEFYWQDTDEVGIFPDLGGYQLGFSLEGQGGKKVGVFDGGGWALRSDAKYSTYYPFNFDNKTPKRIPVSYLDQTQKDNADASHLGNWYFCASEPTAAENGVISFNLHNIGSLIWFSVTMPEPGTYTEISLVTDQTLFTTEGWYSLKDITSDNTSNVLTATRKSSRITLALNGIATTAAGQVVNAYMMAAPFDLTGHAYKLYVKSSDGLFYSADLASKNHILPRNAARKITATVKASDGYNIGIDDWGTGGSIGGDAE